MNQENNAGSTAPAQWHPDPTGRHQYRYWDGVRWTDAVADDGCQSVDPIGAPEAPRRLTRKEQARAAANEVVSEASGNTRLHMACSHGDVPEVRRLLAAGANVNATNRGGATPLDLVYSNANCAGRLAFVQIAQLIRARGGVVHNWRGEIC